MSDKWKQERPEWCPHQDCIFKRRAMDSLCGGELPEPQPHDEDTNTHRFCMREPESTPPIWDLQVNSSDLDWMRWVLDALDGKQTSWLSKRKPTGWKIVVNKWTFDGKPVSSPYDQFHWQVQLVHNDVIVGSWGGPTTSAPNHLVMFSPVALERDIRLTLQGMLRRYDPELWRESPSDFKLHNMIVEACAEILENYKESHQEK